MRCLSLIWTDFASILGVILLLLTKALDELKDELPAVMVGPLAANLCARISQMLAVYSKSMC